jgi:8-oxo-dGTP diphosphatase
MKHYVVGFLFDERKQNVALIRKNRPEFARGRLNGVGGKIEVSDSTPLDAMIREFWEETTVDYRLWTRFAVYFGDGDSGSTNEPFEIHFFCARSNRVWDVLSPTDEAVEVYPVSEILAGREFTMNNLPWLISMALTTESSGDWPYLISEGHGDG